MCSSEREYKEERAPVVLEKQGGTAVLGFE